MLRRLPNGILKCTCERRDVNDGQILLWDACVWEINREYRRLRSHGEAATGADAERGTYVETVLAIVLGRGDRGLVTSDFPVKRQHVLTWLRQQEHQVNDDYKNAG